MGPSLWGGPANPECFLEVFRKVAIARTGEIAVIDGDEEFTYSQIGGWAIQVAEILRSQGVVTDETVAVAGPRSAQVIAAMLGIAIIGAVYLPLDREYPSRRLEHMVSDSGVRIILYSGVAPTAGHELRMIPLPQADVASNFDEDKLLRTWRSRPCDTYDSYYVIYTSGSTGWPKGVKIAHRCLDNMLEWQAAHSPRPDLRTAQFAPMNFDVWFQEVLGTFRGGGTVVIMPEPLRRDPGQLLIWLEAKRIERLFVPYNALQMLAFAATMQPELSGLALLEVNSAGEQLLCSQEIRDLFARLPHTRLVNHYGQSESAMAAFHVLEGSPYSWPSHPPIGVPLPGCELLLDADDPLEPSTGELLVAGLPLSAGYLNQPRLTDERYIEIPRTIHGNARAFRTGDRVEFRSNEIVFKSRLDSEVKIRGVRVDMLELEAQLLDYEGVQSAVCLAPKGPSGRRVLLAAVKVAWQEGVNLATGEDIRRHLRLTLPKEFVPVMINVRRTFPATPSGKVDRLALEKELVELIGWDKSDDQSESGGEEL